jgi:outer membrane PBP1 activator LpoA protein
VATVAASPLVSKPTIALNYPEGYGQPDAAPLPPQMLAMGLSIEEEARQAANGPPLSSRTAPRWC